MIGEALRELLDNTHSFFRLAKQKTACIRSDRTAVKLRLDTAVIYPLNCELMIDTLFFHKKPSLIGVILLEPK